MRSIISGLVALLSAATVAPGQPYVISTYAGGGPPVTPAPATSIAISAQGMAADGYGNLYFVSSNCVFKLDPNGIVTRVAGTSRPDYSGDGGPAFTAQFNSAAGVAVGPEGTVYVADSRNRRMRKVSPAGLVTTVAGTGALGYSGDGGAAIDAQLTGPGALALDSAGSLFIVDANRIRKVSPNGIITTVAGTGVYGFFGDGGPATSAELNIPQSLAVDNGQCVHCG